MQTINWACCPLVQENPLMRAFIEQLARERKSPSTIENYSRDLNDFLSAFPDVPFPDLLEADETQIAHYVDWLWTRDARRGSGHKADRSNITYLTGSKLAPTTIRRRISALRSFYRWAIRLRHRHDSLNPVREGVRGQFVLRQGTRCPDELVSFICFLSIRLAPFDTQECFLGICTSSTFTYLSAPQSLRERNLLTME